MPCVNCRFLRGKHHKKNKRSVDNGFASITAKSHYSPDIVIIPIDKLLELEFSIPEEELVASVTITFQGLVGSKSRKVVLDAVGFRDVSVLPTRDESPFTFHYNGKTLQIVWCTEFKRGETRRVRIGYRVKNPVSGLFFSYPTKEYPERAAYVMSDHETEKARYWIPCMDLPSIRTTLSFSITSAKDMIALANGTLIQERIVQSTPGSEKKITHWRLDYPCPSYLICVAVGDFIGVEELPVSSPTGPIPIAYFAPKDRNKEDLMQSFGPTRRMLEWIQAKLDFSFPFPKYYQVVGEAHVSAMENISLISWGVNWLVNSKSAKEIGLILNSINLHEMAHSYFGDATVIRHFEHAWLKESWATYLEAVWLEDSEGEDEFLFQLYNDTVYYFEEADDDYVRPIVTRRYDSSWSMYDGHLYQGGSIRLHMLRHYLGDDIFWQAVREYLKKFNQKVVETSDFIRVFEEVSGRSLIKFFEQWFYTSGYPKIEGDWDYDEEKKTLKVSLEQVQGEGEDDDDSDGEEGVIFEFDVTIELYGKKGDLVGSLNLEFQHDKPTVVGSLRLNEELKYVQINPQLRSVFSLDLDIGEDLLLATAELAKDVPSRIWAYMQLIKYNCCPSALDGIRKIIRKEKFYGVRVAVADLLSNAPSRWSADILRLLLTSEKDPKALHLIAEACGGFRDKILRAAILEVLDGADSSSIGYCAQANLLGSLGSQNDCRDVSRILQVLNEGDGSETWHKEVDYNGQIRAGALLGLSRIKTDGVVEYLQKTIEYGAEKVELNRSVSVEAYGEAAGHLEDATRRRNAAERLVESLRDPDSRVRMAAAEVLLTSLPQEAKLYESQLLQLKNLLPKQDHYTLDRQFAELHDDTNDNPIYTKLKKKLERLEKRYELLDEALNEHIQMYKLRRGSEGSVRSDGSESSEEESKGSDRKAKQGEGKHKRQNRRWQHQHRGSGGERGGRGQPGGMSRGRGRGAGN